MRIINEQEEKEICDEYIQGLSMTNIAKMRHCSQPRIKNISSINIQTATVQKSLILSLTIFSASILDTSFINGFFII